MIPRHDQIFDPSENAVDFIIETLRNHPEGIKLIALGPLTNIAKVLEANIEITKNIERIFVMGGAFQTEGNVTPYAEFNIYQDPLAANLVFSSGIPISVVGLDVCNAVYVSRDSMPWRVGDSKRSNLCLEILKGWFDYRAYDEKYLLCDPLTLAVAINPNLVKYKSADVRVVEDGIEKGKTIAEIGLGNVKVAMEVDSNDALQYIRSLIS